MKVLITGGAGYIGSITNALLISEGHETVIFDNLSRGHRDAVGRSPLVVGDLTRLSDIQGVFSSQTFDAVIHFAALSLAGESMEKPYDYFQNNFLGALNLLEAMRQSTCRLLIFSSTCAVYGYPKTVPITEKETISPISVYGASKHMVEELIGWYQTLHGIRSVVLRYFNAAGAMLDGSMGEDHRPESHIIPRAIAVALDQTQTFEIFGNDYNTPDGTCIRDYIHVVDLAKAHIAALLYLKHSEASAVINLGVGEGYSNKDVLSVVENVTGKSVRSVVRNRRPGDPAKLWADNAKAAKLLGWHPEHSDLPSIVESALLWHQKNPKGYRK